MKTLKANNAIMIILMFLLSGTMAIAQEKSTQEKEVKDAMEAEAKYKEAQMKAAMEAEMQAKKEMLMQQQQEMKEKQRQMEEQQRKMEMQYSRQSRDLDRQFRESSRERSSGRSTYVLPDGNFYVTSGGQGNQSQLTLRNTFQGESGNTNGDFEVEAGVKHIRVMINGKVKNGEITIKIQQPGGKEFKSMTLDAAAEVTYSQSLTVKEEDTKKYVGSWSYSVKSDKAEGSYMLQIMAH